jgi:translation initiation factor eIF-2B subunit gamma
VGVFLADSNAYCVRVDSLRAYLEVNRELASPADAGHLTGLSLSKHENYLGREVDIGAKSAVGFACIVGWGSKLGDKCTMKRSVMGRRCRTGSGVKIVNSVIHDGAAVCAAPSIVTRPDVRRICSDVVLEDGVQLQGCVVGRGVVLGAGASLRECHVAAAAVVPAGAEHRSESLQRVPR